MSKLGTNIFSIVTTSNYFKSLVVGVVNVDYFNFLYKKIKIINFYCSDIRKLLKTVSSWK